MQFKNKLYFPFFVFIVSIAHLLVDTGSIFLVFCSTTTDNHLLNVLFYTTFAFGMQFLLGFIVDKYSLSKLFIITSVILTIGSILMPTYSKIYIFTAGFGNAFFHVGAGKCILDFEKNKALLSGIFVAPGGIGLALGTYLALKCTSPTTIEFLIECLVVLLIVLLFTKFPKSEGRIVSSVNKKKSIFYGMIFLLLFSIAVRYIVGMTVSFPWKTEPNLLICLTLSIALGKIMGGVLSKKFGLMITGIIGLLISCPLLAFGSSIPILGLLGIFVFNFTMPVTLAAISDLLPNQGGLAFGLATLGIFIGSFPVFTRTELFFQSSWAIVILISLSALSIFLALKNYKELKSIN
jgi:FSR family fosmidomycin resistance protein-like MFS transporter